MRLTVSTPHSKTQEIILAMIDVSVFVFSYDSLALVTMMFFYFWSLGIMGLGELKTRMLCWISKKTEEIEMCILKF